MPEAPARLHSVRLTLTRVQPEDRDFLAALWNDPQVARTLGGTRSPERIDITVARFCEAWDTTGYGVWIFAVDGDPLGYCGLLPTDVGGAGGVELLYAQRPEAGGNGYATEAANEILRVASDDLGLREVVAFTLPDNAASRAVMERSGFSHAGDVDHAGLPHVLYRTSFRRGATRPPSGSARGSPR